MDRFIAFDCETGGLLDECSLLTVYFVVLDHDLKPIDDLDLKIRPNDTLYKVTGEALTVNHINLVQHDQEAISESEAGKKLYEFLELHNPRGEYKFIPIGHNGFFDARIIKKRLCSAWDRYVSYRIMDTGSIAQFFRSLGLIPEDVKGSLESLGAFFGLKMENLHTAKADTLLTVEIMRKMKEKFGAYAKFNS